MELNIWRCERSVEHQHPQGIASVRHVCDLHVWKGARPDSAQFRRGRVFPHEWLAAGPNEIRMQRPICKWEVAAESEHEKRNACARKKERERTLS